MFTEAREVIAAKVEEGVRLFNPGLHTGLLTAGVQKIFFVWYPDFLTSICLIERINIFSFKMRQIALITIWYRKIIYIIILLPLYQRR